MCIFIYTHKHKYTYLSVYVYIYSFLETLRKSERKVEYFYPNTMLPSKTKTQKQLTNIQVWFWTTFCFSCNSRWSFHYGGTLTRGWRGRNTDDSPNMLCNDNVCQPHTGLNMNSVHMCLGQGEERRWQRRLPKTQTFPSACLTHTCILSTGSANELALWMRYVCSIYSVSRWRKLKGSLNITGMVILESSYLTKKKETVTPNIHSKLTRCCLYITRSWKGSHRKQHI